MYKNLPIHQWAVEDRPREKMTEKGASALTDAELLAILIGSGTKNCSALELSRNLLIQTGSLLALGSASLEELTRIKGIGNAKALLLAASFELGKRRARMSVHTQKITNAADAAEYLKTKIGDLRQEVFYVLFFNVNQRIIGEKQLFSGGVSSSLVDVKIILKEAVDRLASGIIIAHNHPSGGLSPSQADKTITERVKTAAQLLDIRLLDHLIIAHAGYYSFADEGLL